jgi:hypothetical protein
MPNWGMLLLVVFLTLGLRSRSKWNVNAIVVALTTVVIAGIAAKEHLLV